MTKRDIIIAGAALLSASACSSDRGKIEIRAIPLAVAAGAKPMSFRLAEAQGQFALGNIGLALESYRKAVREEPGNADALAGVAACYDRMGRFDLSRHNYEAALAIAPGDTRLLAALAASLDLQQLTAEAGRVRQEIGDRLAAASRVQAGERVASAPLSTGQPAAIALLPLLPTTVANAVAAARAESRWPAALPPSASRTSPLAAREAESGSGPRLERTSLGEVALITAPGPLWQAQTAEAAVRKAPTGAALLRQAAVARSGLRIFNAARVDRLASRARAYLSNRGWAIDSVGDVLLARTHSLILYPAGKRAAAMRLSAQFGFAIEQRSDIRQVTILLGHDARSLPIFKAKAG